MRPLVRARGAAIRSTTPGCLVWTAPLMRLACAWVSNPRVRL